MQQSNPLNKTTQTSVGLISTELLGEPAFAIECAELKSPFLMQLITSSDAWAFIGSNGAITAGRQNPDHALFPYYTEDKLFDMNNTSGSCSIIRCMDPTNGKITTWHPLKDTTDLPPTISRRVVKSLSGSKIAVEETHEALKLSIRITWTSSNSLGILRQTQLTSLDSEGPAVSMDVLDGIINVLPASVDQQFQNEFSNLVDAYKRNEWYEPALATYSLSSVPTDKAEPSESLRATTVWSCGFPGEGHLICPEQISAFCKGETIKNENETLGRRGAYLRSGSLTLHPGENKTWWIVSDLDQSAAKVVQRLHILKSGNEAIEEIESSIKEDSTNIYCMISQADGIQISAKSRSTARHFSNALFNLMRGGTFPLGYKIPSQDLRRHIRLCNRQSFERHEKNLLQLPEFIELQDLRKTLDKFAGPELTRIAEEYLPLTFSRRHGDPSRPWNRFSIDITDENENPIFAYQGNWRDIFQNWEALLHTFPLYTDAVISRFLNATTADGYNPYRVTKTGFEWEREEPGSPWSNIGYWGDHQIIYLLKLLEFSFKTNPEHLAGLLNRERYAFADVPYRIKPFSDIVKKTPETPSSTITNPRTRSMPARHKRAPTDSFSTIKKARSFIQVYLKNYSFHCSQNYPTLCPVLESGMNTQRPEWNDANNALAGYGAFSCHPRLHPSLLGISRRTATDERLQRIPRPQTNIHFVAKHP